MSAEFCIYCGASKPPRNGEGTCNECCPEFVFVGGENDGHRMRIPMTRAGFRYQMLLPVPKKAIGFPASKRTEPTVINIDTEWYELEMMACGHETYRFYRAADLSTEQALYLLLRNYNPCSNSKDNRTVGHAR